MGLNIVEKILGDHLVAGGETENEELGIRIDHTLTQDSTGTLAYLQFEAMGIPRVRTKFSVSFVDHNTLQTGFENADDHRYLQTVAAKYGIHFSRPGNGICHQVFLERFAVPGTTLLGSDSHTPTAGGMGVLAIGAGGLDVAVAMAGEPFYLRKPKVCRVKLVGKLQPWVTAKDVILELLRRLSVKGGVGKIFEYGGEGVAGLSVPERATITNMGAELGATTSIFPSDELTKSFLRAQGREGDWRELSADHDAVYDEEVIIDLGALEPLAAKPHSPDNVVPVRELVGTPVTQVLIGSCTNASYADLMKVAKILQGKTVHPNVSLAIAPGSRQVMQMLAQNGGMAAMVGAGARILENACGPCIGMGQAPESGGVSLRTFNRNFPGRSGTADAKVYLVSPETAAVSALNGVVTDPRGWGEPVSVVLPERFMINDNMIIPPPQDGTAVAVVRGPNIAPLQTYGEMEDLVAGTVLLKVGDNITTDHIMPSHAKLLPFRSNIPYLAGHCFEGVDKDFPARAKAAGGGMVIAGENYGQGSSREHAALVPKFLGVRAVIAKSFARIHYANLINMGILPLTFANPEDYAKVAQGDGLTLRSVREKLQSGETAWTAEDERGNAIVLKANFSARQRKILLAGGLLNYSKQA